MNHLGCRLVSVLVVLFELVAVGRLSAQSPSIETLVAGVPVLSTEDEKVDNFRFTFETPLPYEMPFIAQFEWKKQDTFRILVTAGEERIPCIFLSQKTSMLFDVTTDTAMITENTKATFVLRIDGNDVTFDIRLNGSEDKETKVIVDLRGFLSEATNNGKLVQGANGDWQLTTTSKSGNGKAIATFENSKGYPLRSLEIRATEDDSLGFVVRNISVNEKFETALPAFPERASFPKDMKVMQPGEVEGLTGAVGHLFRTFLAHGALRHPESRKNPLLSNVDWDAAKKCNEEHGVALRDLLKVPPPTQTTKPDEDAGQDSSAK